jgi:hypothetical protein
MSILIKQTLEDYFKKDEILTEQIFNQLTLYIFSLNSDQHDLYLLAKLLDNDSLQKIISYYDGDILRLPTREEYKTNILTALCFWLKTFKGYSWFEIKDYLKIPENNKDLLSSISIGGKINKIKDNLGKDLVEILEKIDEKQFIDFYNRI